MSFALYPQEDNFFHQARFCDVASHIWQVTCQDKNRKYFLDLQQPDLCQTLEYFEDYFDVNSTCQNWPHDFLHVSKKPNNTLLEEMVKYGRKNLAVVRVMIQSPYVTRIKRDVSMTFTTYVANSGGLLGLCVGFSFISGIELIFWFCCCCRIFKKKVPCQNPCQSDIYNQSHQTALKQPSESHQTAIKQLSYSHQTAVRPYIVIRHSLDIHQIVMIESSQSSEQTSDFHQEVIKQSLGSHQAVIRQSSGSHQAVIRQSSGSHQAVIRQSSGRHQAVISRTLIRK